MSGDDDSYKFFSPSTVVIYGNITWTFSELVSTPERGCYLLYLNAEEPMDSLMIG